MWNPPGLVPCFNKCCSEETERAENMDNRKVKSCCSLVPKESNPLTAELSSAVKVKQLGDPWI